MKNHNISRITRTLKEAGCSAHTPLPEAILLLARHPASKTRRFVEAAAYLQSIKPASQAQPKPQSSYIEDSLSLAVFVATHIVNRLRIQGAF